MMCNLFAAVANLLFWWYGGLDFNLFLSGFSFAIFVVAWMETMRT